MATNDNLQQIALRTYRSTPMLLGDMYPQPTILRTLVADGGVLLILICGEKVPLGSQTLKNGLLILSQVQPELFAQAVKVKEDPHLILKKFGLSKTLRILAWVSRFLQNARHP